MNANSNKPLEQQLERWKQVLLVYIGAVAMLVILGYVEFPAIHGYAGQLGYLNVDGWFGVWLVLLVGSLATGFFLTALAKWREIPLERRLSTIFGYLGVAWMALVALDLRIMTFLSGNINALVVGLGVGLALAYVLILRWLRRPEKSENLFP